MKTQAVFTAVVALCFGIEACLLPDEVKATRHASLHGRALDSPSRASLGRREEEPPVETGIPIGTGDRFQGGRVAPRGRAFDRAYKTSVLTPEEVSSGAEGLARAFQDMVSVRDAPERTHEGRVTKVLQVGGRAGDGGAHVFIQSGIHARERGGPDYVLYFLADLVEAHSHGTGVVFGRKAYTSAQVAAALSVEIVAMPLMNPDGVAHDQRTGSCWRKNRNPNGGADERLVGTDLNRNYDFLWDYERHFSPGLLLLWAPASDDPAATNYRGAAPFSEPETRNSRAVLDANPGLVAFIDVHSVIGKVLYAWGDDDAQTKEPEENFANKLYDELRGVEGPGLVGGIYGEFMEALDLANQTAAVGRMTRAMNEASDDVVFAGMPAFNLYPTCGASSDYALSLYYNNTAAGRPRILSLTIEFGSKTKMKCPFYSTTEQYNEWMVQTAAGLMEVLLDAAATVSGTKIEDDDC